MMRSIKYRLRRMLRRRNVYTIIGLFVTTIILTLWTVGLPKSREQVTAIRQSDDETAFPKKSWHDQDYQGNIPNHLVEGSVHSAFDENGRLLEKMVLPGRGEIASGDCEGLKAPSFAYINHFQKVDVNDSENHVFSAYYDKRNGDNYVRIIGIMRVKKMSNLYCQMWYIHHGHVSINVVDAEVEGLYQEGQLDRTIESVLISCRSNQKRTSPYFVSVVRGEKCQYGRNRLSLITLLTRIPDRPSFAVCLSPLRNGYGDVDNLLEIVALNQMLGAEKIFMYDANSSLIAQRLMRALAFDKMVTLIPWKLPDFTVSNQMPYLDEMGMRHECLLRGMGRFRHLVYTGMDEILIPQRDDNWLDLFLRYKFEKHSPSMVVYNMVDFNKNFTNDVDTNADNEVKHVKSTFLLKTRRFSMKYKPESHSSYIIDPLQVLRLSKHKIVEFSLPNSNNEETISSDEALLHRYSSGKVDKKLSTVTDRSILRFQGTTVKRLQKLRRTYARILQEG